MYQWQRHGEHVMISIGYIPFGLS